MKWSFVLALKHELIRQIKKKEIAAIPELIAFNFMMAFIPLLIVFFQILAFLSIETSILDETIAHYLPAELYSFLTNFLETASLRFSNHPLLIALTVGTLIFTISKGVNGIFKAFAITHTDEQEQPVYKRRLSAILTFFLLLIFTSLATAMIAVSHTVLGTFHSTVKTLIELTILGLACFGFFFLLFLLATPNKSPTRKILPGSSLTSIGFMIMTTVFTYYVDRLANFHLIYGSLAAIIILLIWLYLLGFVINLGIQVNYILSGQPASDFDRR